MIKMKKKILKARELIQKFVNEENDGLKRVIEEPAVFRLLSSL